MPTRRWGGWMRGASTSGRKGGGSRVTAGAGSRRHPPVGGMTFTAMRKPQGGNLRSVSPPVMACGTPLMVRIQENSAAVATMIRICARSEEHTSELQSPDHLVCRLLLEKKKT